MKIKGHHIIIVLLLNLICGTPVYAIDIKGIITDKKTNEPISFVHISSNGQENWTFSDKTGSFHIHISETNEETKLLFQCLGYQEKVVDLPISSDGSINLSVKLIPTTLALNEVTVTAKAGANLSTSSLLNRNSIEHSQANTVYDALQLLPGNLIENSDLSQPQQLSIREIDQDANTAAGVAVIMDGVQMDNDANIQVVSTNNLVPNENLAVQKVTYDFATTFGRGIDARQLSVDQVESIEVIRGIPSVKYGNLTSGAVIVHSKNGVSPLEVKLKSEPIVKQAYISKGFEVGEGVMNVGLDYLHSSENLVEDLHTFNRANGNLGYSRTFGSNEYPLRFNARLNFFSSFDNEKTDEDALTANEDFRSENQGGALSVNGNWLLKKKWLTNLDYNINASVDRSYSYQKKYRSGGQAAVSTSYEDGENYGVLLPSRSLTETSVEGIPVQFNLKLIGNVDQKISSKGRNRILYGADYLYKSNEGDGVNFDVANPAYVSENNSRPRSYKDIPALKTLAFFLEENISLPINKSTLELQAGVRIQNFQSQNLLQSDIGWYGAPSVNLRYKIRNNFSLRAGAGVLYKQIPLVYLYPNTTYFDLQSLYHYSDSVQYRSVVFTTKTFQDEPELKPTKNTKFELGLDWDVNDEIKLSLTGFSEKLENGYGFARTPVFIPFKKYDSSNTPENEIPDITTLPYEMVDFIGTYTTPVNNRITEKQGVEYILNLGKWDALYTRFIVDGAWLRTKRVLSTQPVYYYPGQQSSGIQEYVGVYPAGETRVQERLNTTLRMVTHIPSLRAVLTTTTQAVWYEKLKYPYYSGVPDYLLNKDGEQIPFTEEMQNDVQYRYYDLTSSDIYFNQEKMPPLFMVNIRLTKEIGDYLKLSFYTNNILNQSPLYESNRGLGNIRRNPAMYFGADLRLYLN